ncbi:Tn3 family transposase [Nonomuraea fuscirosea]|uniref:Tn3 family transposase n=1 Tax=Nonomuraea fuscirosea TaxID=1291556 RepID=UPI003F4CFCFF
MVFRHVSHVRSHASLLPVCVGGSRRQADERTRYTHIEPLFGEEVIDWGLIETHWTDLLRTAISIRESRLSSVTLLRRLGNHSRKNRLYRAFRELGRSRTA